MNGVRERECVERGGTEHKHNMLLNSFNLT